MSHDHMAHMMNVSGGHASHDLHAAHQATDHSSMHNSMDHSAMDHSSMGHGGHPVASTAEACANMGMHGMSVRIVN